RNHDFAYDGVAELEDRMDHLFLFFFDSGFFRRNLRHRSYLGLRDERTALHPFAWRHDVRDDNETADQRVQTRNTRQTHNDRRDDAEDQAEIAAGHRILPVETRRRRSACSANIAVSSEGVA